MQKLQYYNEITQERPQLLAALEESGYDEVIKYVRTYFKIRTKNTKFN